MSLPTPGSAGPGSHPSRHGAVVVDARSLQDPEYAGRGVGRHATALLQFCPPCIADRLVALTDPVFPPLAGALAARFAAVATTPYAARRAAARLSPPRLSPPHLSPSRLFVSLSPMTHDQLLVARFLGDPTVRSIAAVYDFIPLRHPERYLAAASAPLAYALSLYWLGRFSAFAPISHSAAADLERQLGPSAARIQVTGAPLSDRFATLRDTAGPVPTGVLVVGGDDPRKDPQTVVRAHARSAAMQRTRAVLTVAGNYAPWHHGPLFSGIAAAEGGDPDLVRVPGHLPDDDLVALYRSAACVVCPSVDEGFSLPVIEGMAAGAVVYASDIPAHRELIADPARLFPPGDAARLAAIFDAGHDSPGAPAARALVLAAQDAVWPGFRAAAVADRFWSHALAGLSPPPDPLPAPAVRRGARPRIALLSPLPPDRSGVADYTAAACAEIARLSDLDVFTGNPQPTPIPGVARTLPFSDLPGTSPAYDRTVAVVGNSEFHVPVMDHLTRFGGACIAHDARMLGYYFHTGGIRRVAAVASAELGRRVPLGDVMKWAQDERSLPTPLLSEVAAVSSPMIVHSPVTQALLHSRFGVAATLLPFCIYRPFQQADHAPEARAAARARLGIAPDGIVLATFGFVDMVKAPLDCLWALQLLRSWNLDASLHFVGQYQEGNPAIPYLPGVAAELGVAGHVRLFDGFTPEPVFRDYLLAADVGIQLRTYGGLGGLSGALLDCAAAGLPMVTNSSLAEAVGLPPAYSRVIPDTLSPVLLAEAVADLVAAGRGPVQDEARRRFTAERSLARYARQLMTALDLD